jgi:hypothetical protein
MKDEVPLHHQAKEASDGQPLFKATVTTVTLVLDPAQCWSFLNVRCGLDHAPDVGSQSEHIATATLHTEETMKNNVLYISNHHVEGEEYTLSQGSLSHH